MGCCVHRVDRMDRMGPGSAPMPCLLRRPSSRSGQVLRTSRWLVHMDTMAFSLTAGISIGTSTFHLWSLFTSTPLTPILLFSSPSLLCPPCPYSQNPVDLEFTWFYGDSWAQMYAVDPEPFGPLAAVPGGPPVGRALGGEASMWTEQVDDLNLDSQVFPRVGAPAERLWSPSNLTDAAAAAPRLSALRCRLDARYGIRAGPIWSDFCSASSPSLLT